MIRKSRGPDHIREHVEKRGYKHNYMLYGKGAYYYDLPYWTFVHLAKDAGATVDLHRIRPTEPVFNERISAALSMKVVSNKYLLKNEG